MLNTLKLRPFESQVAALVLTEHSNTHQLEIFREFSHPKARLFRVKWVQKSVEYTARVLDSLKSRPLESHVAAFVLMLHRPAHQLATFRTSQHAQPRRFEIHIFTTHCSAHPHPDRALSRTRKRAFSGSSGPLSVSDTLKLRRFEIHGRTTHTPAYESATVCSSPSQNGILSVIDSYLISTSPKHVWY